VIFAAELLSDGVSKPDYFPTIFETSIISLQF